MALIDTLKPEDFFPKLARGHGGGTRSEACANESCRHGKKYSREGGRAREQHFAGRPKNLKDHETGIR